MLPGSSIGKALNYTKNLWDSLQAYLYNGDLHIDNNLVEDSIRPNALGRKNYLFAGSHEGAQRTAMFYSFPGTCKINGVNPEKWLVKVLNQIADHKVNKLQELFPGSFIREIQITNFKYPRTCSWSGAYVIAGPFWIFRDCLEFILQFF